MGFPTDVEGRLRAERARRLAQAAALQHAFDGLVASSADSNADDEHDPEGATIAFERSQLASQLAQAQDDVREVDDALRRQRAGTYGTCQICGGTITAERLEARPTAAACIACASRTSR